LIASADLEESNSDPARRRALLITLDVKDRTKAKKRKEQEGLSAVRTPFRLVDLSLQVLAQKS
jgi:hypothetical protein